MLPSSRILMAITSNVSTSKENEWGAGLDDRVEFADENKMWR
jgi:hypothetical protein